MDVEPARQMAAILQQSRRVSIGKVRVELQKTFGRTYSRPPRVSRLVTPLILVSGTC